jgi:WD40 repeat protein
VACGGYKEPAIVWDAISGEKKFEVDNNRTTIPGVYWTGFSADSKFLYTGGHSIYRGIFETATGKLHGQFETNRQSTWHMGFSADGRFVASGIDSFCVYDLAARKIRHTFPSSQTVAHAISVDGRTVAVLNNAHDNPAVVLWDVLTGRERARFPLPKGYFPSGRLCFSPDGRMLAATTPSYASDSLHVWDLATRNELGPFPGHLDSITAVAFSPDSRRMATASGDGTVLIREIIPEARR